MAHGDTSITIRSTEEDDWEAVRTLRLEMLRDTPLAYGETLASAKLNVETDWRARARRGTDPHSASFAAIDDATGRWIGTMGGFLVRPGDAHGDEAGPMLVGVYVTPAFRGSEHGVTDLLLAAVEHWATTEGTALTLHVHAENPRAIAFYERRGFERTGRTMPYTLEPYGIELEMRKTL